MPLLLTLRDAAEQLNVSQRTIYRWMEQNLLHPFKLGKSWRFEQSDIDNFIRMAREQAECISRNDKEGFKRAYDEMTQSFKAFTLGLPEQEVDK